MKTLNVVICKNINKIDKNIFSNSLQFLCMIASLRELSDKVPQQITTTVKVFSSKDAFQCTKNFENACNPLLKGKPIQG